MVENPREQDIHDRLELVHNPVAFDHVKFEEPYFKWNFLIVVIIGAILGFGGSWVYSILGSIQSIPSNIATLLVAIMISGMMIFLLDKLWGITPRWESTIDTDIGYMTIKKTADRNYKSDVELSDYLHNVEIGSQVNNDKIRLGFWITGEKLGIKTNTDHNLVKYLRNLGFLNIS